MVNMPCPVVGHIVARLQSYGFIDTLIHYIDTLISRISTSLKDTEFSVVVVVCFDSKS